MRRWGLVAAALALPLAASCKLNTDCSRTGLAGIQLAVQDTFTNEAIADSVFGTAQGVTSSYLDTLLIIELGLDGKPWRIGGVVDRPGVYDVVLKRPGYYDWAVTGVTVAAGACGIEPVIATARMCPYGPTCDAIHAP